MQRLIRPGHSYEAWQLGMLALALACLAPREVAAYSSTSTSVDCVAGQFQSASFDMISTLGATMAVASSSADYSNNPVILQPISNLPASEFSIVNVVPNPSRGMTTVRCSVPAAGRITVEVFDIAGRRLTAFDKLAVGAGDQDITWDGATGFNVHVASGVYLLRLSYKNRAAAIRCVRIR